MDEWEKKRDQEDDKWLETLSKLSHKNQQRFLRYCRWLQVCEFIEDIPALYTYWIVKKQFKNQK